MVEDNQITKKYILLVDDNESDVKIVVRVLLKATSKYSITVVNDGQEALDYLHATDSKNPKPDIILLDINMPNMDGHTFVRELKMDPNIASIPIIVFTTKEGMAGLFKIEGVNDYVVKSMDAKSLISKIDKYID